MKLEDKNPIKRDGDVDFYERDHKYIVKGNKDYISVTTFIHNFFHKFDAEKVIEKNYKKWQNNNHPKYKGKTKKEIKSMWNKKAEKSSNHGTDIHKKIEDYLNELIEPTSDVEFQYFLNFLEDYTELEPFRTELIVYLEEVKLCGTIDLVAKDKDDNYYIIDHKTNDRIERNNDWQKGLYPISHLDHCNFNHYSLQLSVYKSILESKYGIKVKGLYLLWLSKSNTNYELIEVPYLNREVKDMFSERILELYK